MESRPYLIFSLHGLDYGVDASQVLEIFYLPELTAITEAPTDIVGVLNLRGKVIPVMHLDLRFGHQLKECSLTDSVILLEWKKFKIGIIVSSVDEVKSINIEALETEIIYDSIAGNSSRLITGVAKFDDKMIMLLNHENLFCYSNKIELLLEDKIASDDVYQQNTQKLKYQFLENYKDFVNSRVSTPRSFYSDCCPNATPEEKAIFRERAKNLIFSNLSSDFIGLIPLAVVGLNSEYFGLDLKVVREFINIRNVTPIPCCPPHIIGNINLRGEIVTLVDIRGALNIPFTPNSAFKAVVIQVDEFVAGLPVDEIFDVIYLLPSEVMSIPTAVYADGDEYLRGTAPYEQKLLSILDLPKIFTKGELTVNEEL